MRSQYFPALSLAAALTLTATAGAQGTAASGQGTADSGQGAVESSQGTATGQDATRPETTRSGSQASETLKIVGCVQKESEALGTRGLGVGDEYVLTDVGAAMASAGGASSANATAGDPPAGRIYTLTGDREDDLDSMVGKRVEITGRMEDGGDSMSADASAASGGAAAGTSAAPGATGTSGSTTVRDEADERPEDAPAANTGSSLANQPGYEGARSPDARAGIEAHRRAESLPRVEITSFREVEGDCQAPAQR